MANEWQFLYRYIWKLPANDPRLDGMTRYDFELEVMAHFEIGAILNGNKKPGPSQGFLDKARELLSKGAPVTPQEVGWDK